jgi:hypothetical protein
MQLKAEGTKGRRFEAKENKSRKEEEKADPSPPSAQSADGFGMTRAVNDRDIE